MDGEIPPEEVAELLDADAGVRVVDIRPEEAFERGHIPDSENLPFHALADEIERLDGAEQVVTVCPHGQASVQAARLVGSYEGVPNDARVKSMAGGLEAWERELERGDDGNGDGENREREANEDATKTDSEGPEAPF